MPLSCPGGWASAVALALTVGRKGLATGEPAYAGALELADRAGSGAGRELRRVASRGRIAGATANTCTKA